MNPIQRPPMDDVALPDDGRGLILVVDDEPVVRKALELCSKSGAGGLFLLRMGERVSAVYHESSPTQGCYS